MTTPRIAIDQAGLFSRAQAAEEGWSKGAVDRALSRGTIVGVALGVYMESAAVAGLSQREVHLAEARGQILCMGDQWHAARRTAAVLHGLPLLGTAPGSVQLTRTRTTARVRSRSRHRHINGLPAEHTTVLDGLPTTTLARTVVDIARRESFRSGVVVADAALAAGLDPDELQAVLRQQRGWPGARRARDVLAFADGRAASPLESLGRTCFREAGLPVFEPQVEVWRDGELLARVDGLWWDELVVFEGDGAMKFTGPGVLPALIDRHERLRDAGLDVVRADWADVTRRRTRLVERARTRLAAAGANALAPGVRLVRTPVRPEPLAREDHYRWPVLRPVYATPRSGGVGDGPARGVA